ncbi:helix-turn-helix transcriptional regulator [Algibacter sp.]|uniref:helix-turn-helix transcriptional regulator n=1 Tax=Algibacter sp. TaxID=1872428 RepID=UPI003C7113EC
MNLKFFYKLIFIVVLLFGFPLVSQNEHNGRFLKYIDSASNSIEKKPKIAALFLDSIPEPLNKNIKGHLACYYELKVLINDKNDESSKLYQNSVLALKYAELEKNYDIAGWASLELFYNSYIVKKDSSAYKYLKKAQKYYELSDNKNGIAEVTQMQALTAVNRKDYSKSNQLLLNSLDDYKRIEDDAYYHMYALFLLTTNYIELDSLSHAHKYFKTLRSLKDNATIPSSLHRRHVATIYGSLGAFHFKKKDIDSTLFYLSKSESVRNAMNDYDKRNYYNLYIDYYDFKEDYKSKNNYIDSLRVLEDYVLKKTMNASLLMGNTLMQSETELGIERKGKNTIKIWLIGLFIVLSLVSVFYVVKHKRSKKLVSSFEKNNDEYTYLKSNHEKLKAKVHGLEEYIVDVKKEIKNISSIDGTANQQHKIKELYKNLHINAPLLLDKNEDHLKLVNELNIDFFTRIKNEFPQLTSSEIIICYYLFVGFKSKEIAVFLKSSTRAIEGKRYRISKKMNLQKSELSLADYLYKTFKNT